MENQNSNNGANPSRDVSTERAAEAADSSAGFIAKVSRQANGCWEWQGSRNNRGYGHTSGGLAHRCSYEMFVGPIPVGQLILHKCNNRPCVNPAHLYPGSQKQNMADSRDAGTLMREFTFLTGTRSCPQSFTTRQATMKSEISRTTRSERGSALKVR